MSDCKQYQKMIQEFDRGHLSYRNEEAFVTHLEECPDCREEFEIYYIIEYGLNDEQINERFDAEDWSFLEKYDFKGLIEKKLQSSYERIEVIKRHELLLKECFISGNLFLLLTMAVFIIVKYL